jgi:hypothetical protein
VGEQPRDRLAVGEQVPVVVDVDGDGEAFLEHRAERDPAAKARQVAQVADDAAGVVRGAGEGEADGRGHRGATRPDEVKPLHDPREAPVQVVPAGRHGDALRHLPAALHRRKAETGTAGVERQHDAGVA